MAPHLVAELARVARARDDDRDPVVRPDAGRRGSGTSGGPRATVCVGGVQTIFFRISRLAGPCTARLWSWSVEGLIQTLSSCRSASSLSQMPSYSSPPTKRKLSWPEPVDGRVVDHPARLVAERRVRDLSDREPARVARDRRLDQRLRVGAEHLPLAERREVHDRRFLPARPVLRDRSLVVEAMRKPVPAVLGEALRQLARPRVEVVSRVSTGSASAVTRRAIAVENVCSAGYTRTWTSVICHPFAGSMSSGHADEAQTRSSWPAGARSRRDATTARPSRGTGRRRPC